MIITHQHIDHLGLVEIIAERSGAEVAAIDVAVAGSSRTSATTPSATTSSRPR